MTAQLMNESGNEFEFELESSGSAEEGFYNHLAAMADRGGRSQALRRVALAAAREALRGAVQPAPIIEGEFEGELELESELESELELEYHPARRATLEATLEHMAHAATLAETEQEAAEQFLPLIPFAAKFALPLLGKALPGLARGAARLAPRLIRRVVPNLTRGVGNLTRALYRNPTTRPMLRAVPNIARDTLLTLGRQMARGGPVTPALAARTLARHTARVLGNPRALSNAYRRSLLQDRRYHQHSRRALGAPTSPALLGAACPNCGYSRG